MAGTADNYVVANIAMGPGKFYTGLAIPGVNGRLILASDGTPDATQNPSAKHMGSTTEGTEWLIKSAFQYFFDDEHPADPLFARETQGEKVISGNMMQILDMDLAAILMPTATRSDLAGTQGLTFGSGVLSYQSVAVIWPIEGSSPTIYGVMHLYRAINDAGLASQITSKKPGATPFAFRGQAITTRAATDTTGRYFKQTPGATS